MRSSPIKPDPSLYVDLTEGNTRIPPIAPPEELQNYIERVHNKSDIPRAAASFGPKENMGRRELGRCWRCDRCLGEVEGVTMGTLLISCRRCGAKNRIALSPVAHTPLTNALDKHGIIDPTE